MPELTELDKATASMTEKRKEETASSDSDSDDTIPELEDAGNITLSLLCCIKKEIYLFVRNQASHRHHNLIILMIQKKRKY